MKIELEINGFEIKLEQDGDNINFKIEKGDEVIEEVNFDMVETDEDVTPDEDIDVSDEEIDEIPEEELPMEEEMEGEDIEVDEDDETAPKLENFQAFLENMKKTKK